MVRRTIDWRVDFEMGKPRIFKTKWFQRFARKEGVKDEALVEAVARAERGQVDANLGCGVIKQRIARPGQGRPGGHRTIIVFRQRDRAVFMYGFAKSTRANIGTDVHAWSLTPKAPFLGLCCSRKTS